MAPRRVKIRRNLAGIARLRVWAIPDAIASGDAKPGEPSCKRTFAEFEDNSEGEVIAEDGEDDNGASFDNTYNEYEQALDDGPDQESDGEAGVIVSSHQACSYYVTDTAA
jgi:hypothetical protein